MQDTSAQEDSASVCISAAAEHSDDGLRAAGRLFLRNLPYAATEADLAELMGEYGQLAEVHLVMDR